MVDPFICPRCDRPMHYQPVFTIEQGEMYVTDILRCPRCSEVLSPHLVWIEFTHTEKFKVQCLTTGK